MTLDWYKSPLMLWAFEKKVIDILKSLRFDKCCKNTLKIYDYRKSVLFCQYLWNQSSDLYEILNLSSWPPQKNRKDAWTHTRAPIKNTHTNILLHLRIFTTGTGVCVHTSSRKKFWGQFQSSELKHQKAFLARLNTSIKNNASIERPSS